MVKEKLTLSDKAQTLYNEALSKTQSEIQSFNNTRTRFFYLRDFTHIETIDLREMIDSLIEEFKLRNPFNDRNSSYAKMVNNKAFEIFNMKIHRLSPHQYLIALKKKNGKYAFIIRDSETSPYENYLIEFDGDDMTKGNVSMIDFHISKETLDME